MKLARPLLPAVFFLAAATGCSAIKMQGTVTTTTTSADGTTTSKSRDFHNFDEMTTALDGAAGDLGDTTQKLVKKLVDAPPPGEVKLKDLDPGLEKFQGKKDRDFLASAPEHKFTYVQIGVDSYDRFFKASAELYALTYQFEKTLAELQASTDAGADVTELKELSVAMANLASGAVAKISDLVSSGQALVTGAPASITNPKTALHLKLIVKGLKESIAVVSQSAKPLTDLGSAATSLGASKKVASR